MTLSAVKLRRWLPLLAWTGLVGLLLFQAWAYWHRLPLSLGPRVILQPWLLRQGFVLYEDIVDLHSPLMPLSIAALVPLVPDGLVLAKLLLVTLISVTTLLVFLLGRRAAGGWGGLWAAGFFVVWSPLFGFGKLWHETFLAPLYALLVLLADPCVPRRPLRFSLCAGLLGGVAILFKQHAVVVFAAWIAWNVLAGRHFHRSWPDLLRETGRVVCAAALPVLAFVVYQAARAGTLDGFLYWTVQYSLSEYRSLATQLPTVAQAGAVLSSGLLVPAAALALFDARRRGEGTWLHLGWGLLLLAASSATVYPRFEPFHLQAALPVLAVLSSLALVYALRTGSVRRFFIVGVALATSVFWLVTAGSAYRPVVEAGPSRPIWEYADLVPLAQQVRERVGPSACIYVFPDEEATANLYYLTRCAPPGLWIFHYSWYMMDWTRERVLAMLEDSQPEWIVYFPDRYVSERSLDIIAYIESHYQQEARLAWAQGEAWLLQRLP